MLLIGTPLMWWAFVPMLLWLAWHWITTRDWRAGAVWVAFLAGWLVWFQNLKRTMFLFYMAPLVPFLIIGADAGAGRDARPRCADLSSASRGADPGPTPTQAAASTRDDDADGTPAPAQLGHRRCHGVSSPS